MRILAIRGTNLASLPEFEIDFTAEPLSRSGLFAITGRTGAGKSTILDALCVALFDKTPRLSAHGGALIGSSDEDDVSKLNSNDVRSLLRRGTASGKAEVDFAGHDGRNYKAVWQVRRANQKASGRFQAQEVSLYDLETGQPLGGKKTETLELIQQKIGLTYDQFRRSVLLAQGEFAAFLRADGRERAELLEKITGSDIYGRLSMAAFNRKKEEEQKLQELERRLGDLQIMEDDERTAVQETCDRLANDLAQTRNRSALLEKSATWYARQIELGGLISEGEKNLAVANLEHDKAAGIRGKLADAEQAERLRALVTDVDRSTQELEAATAAETKVREELQTAEEELGRLSIILKEQEINVADADAACTAEKPRFVMARDLDTRIGQSRRILANESGQLVKLRQETEKLSGEKSAIEKRMEASRKLAGEAEEWLAANSKVAPLAGEWGRWSKELERYAVAHQVRHNLSYTRAQTLINLEKAVKELQNATTIKARSELEVAAAREALAGVERAAEGFDLGELRLLCQRYEERLNQANALLQLSQRAKASSKELADAEQQAIEAGECVAAAIKRQQALSEESIGLRGALAEAERALALTIASLDLAGHRGELKEGEECPLCGSLEHPFAAAGAPVESLATAQKLRVGELQAQSVNVERELATTEANRLAREKDHQRESVRAEACREELGKLQREWEKGRGVLNEPLPEQVTAPLAEEAALRFSRELALLCEEQKEKERNGLKLVKAVAPAREALDKGLKTQEAARATFQARELESRSAEAAREKLDDELQRQEERILEIIHQLESPLGPRENWQEKLSADPVGFSDKCALWVSNWKQWEEKKTKAVEEAAEATAGIEAIGGRLQALRDTLAAREESFARGNGDLAVLEAERKTFWSGRAVADVEQELENLLLAAKTASAATAKQVGEAEARRATADGVRGATNQALDCAKELQLKSMAALKSSLADSGLDEAQVRELLGLGEEWLKTNRAALATLEGTVRDAATVLEERRKTAALHEESERPEVAAEAISPAREEAAAMIETLERALMLERVKLEQDATAQQNAALLAPAIMAQKQQTILWQGMNELMGSADGKKFRSFAQSLTLDILLGLANGHLQSLSPRFAIMRVPSSEMELQMIDREMGDDIRSVNNISGGESFLVSLALALGLSSLASGSSGIGSLFIDEGFGSLDQNTLDVALATLDALQASGRMVGVISHVAGLTERIGTRIEVKPYGGGRSRVEVKAV